MYFIVFQPAIGGGDRIIQKNDINSDIFDPLIDQ